MVGVAADGRQFAFGASGGRKILGAVMQLSSFVMYHGMSLEQSFHQPRIDVSGSGQATAEQALAPEIVAAPLTGAADVHRAAHGFPLFLRLPAGVLRDGRHNTGCTEIMSPWGDAVSAAGPGRN